MQIQQIQITTNCSIELQQLKRTPPISVTTLLVGTDTSNNAGSNTAGNKKIMRINTSLMFIKKRLPIATVIFHLSAF